ncbi:CpaF family protein [Rhodanobacter sp. 115]|uniref:CpaF family protein n=1 Tax=Rhodanobacter sp. FW021-MT20 TaxID=1162282 RepID=UPI0034E4C3E5
MAEIKVEKLALSQFRSHLKAISTFMDDPAVQEIMVNRPGEVWIEKQGEMRRVEVDEISQVNLRTAIAALAGANDRSIEPVLDCRMPGFRIAAALAPVGIHGPAICIRKHGNTVRTLDDYLPSFVWGRAKDAKGNDAAPDLRSGTPESIRDYVRWLVRTRRSVLIAGGTSSGKTTFLNGYVREIPADERLITIEDTAELKVVTPNYVSLETNPTANVGIRELVRLSLRFRPDRIVVGEVRGGECYDLLDAMNTGHEGGATTLHANSPIDALARLESMVRMSGSAANLPLAALRRQIASAFAAVIYCKHRGAVRGPEQIMEIHGATDEGYVTRTVFDATTDKPTTDDNRRESA